ncbi:hypothetical protein CTA1_3040 [Colletotrichum tanaceti]|uniref:Uncharacterized protein n=1 Tax=Colletotrichum tanaceti TaxID=1306861 RepID=A0A4U6XQ39_9PEZI|nr:hypothetical protein CTA1_3040 [Colletotrichum tanaceti]
MYLLLALGLGRLLDQTQDQPADVPDVHVAPSAEPPAHLQAAAAVQRRLGQRGDLDAAPVDGAGPPSVDDGGEHQRRVDRGLVGGDLEDVVVDGAARVSPDEGAQLRDAGEVVEDAVAGLARAAGFVGELTGGEDAGARDLDPMRCTRMASLTSFPLTLSRTSARTAYSGCDSASKERTLPPM